MTDRRNNVVAIHRPLRGSDIYRLIASLPMTVSGFRCRALISRLFQRSILTITVCAVVDKISADIHCVRKKNETTEHFFVPGTESFINS